MFKNPDYVTAYLQQLKIPFVVIEAEILVYLANDNNEQTMDQLLDSLLTVDLKTTFNSALVIYYREVITEEILIYLHNYIRNHCGDIENVILITIHGVGIKRYYTSYCQLNRTRGFHIIETPFMMLYEKYITKEIEDNLYILPKKEKITSLFSFYGGRYELDPPERTVMTLFASRFADIAQVEIMTNAAPWSKVEDYLEYLTYFKDVTSIDKYHNNYTSIVNEALEFKIPSVINTIGTNSDERFTRQGPQWQIDSNSFFSLVRETSCTQNFYNLTEKTIRCFFHGVAPIPLHGDYIIEDLKALGFIINEDFINYDYLKEENLFYRLTALEKQLNQFRNEMTFDNWYSLWIDNYEIFRYNCEYLLKTYKKETIKNKLDTFFK